jgi:hypothetical protein
MEVGIVPYRKDRLYRHLSRFGDRPFTDQLVDRSGRSIGVIERPEVVDAVTVDGDVQYS